MAVLAASLTLIAVAEGSCEVRRAASQREDSLEVASQRQIPAIQLTPGLVVNLEGM